MFTGLVEGVGTIERIHHGHNDMTITVMPPFDVFECQVGDSVAINGVCLTVTELFGNSFSLYVSGETLSRTTLRYAARKQRVNVERALLLSDRLGGHIVSGHVDGPGTLQYREQRDKSWLIRISVSKRLTRYIIEKGSVAVDGISLTVNRCDADSFDVNIIPQTGQETTLLEKKVGDVVNIETDIIGKYVESLLGGIRCSDKGMDSRINLDFIKKHGFGD